MKRSLCERTIVVLLLSCLSEAAFAFSPYPNVQGEVSNISSRIAVIDEDGRMTEEEYANKKGKPIEEIQSRFAATGLLTCGKWRQSAQLSACNQTITTAGHIFKNLDCTSKSSPEMCTFKIKKGSVVQQVGVSNLVAMGITCPGKHRRESDWAVLKLKQPIIGIKPYVLPYADDEVKEGEEVTSVAALADDFRRRIPKSGKIGNPKSIEECRVRKAYYTNGVQTLFFSDCDSGAGSSGGATLRPRAKWDVVMAITVANNESAGGRGVSVESGVVNRHQFSVGKWATYHVPLTGEFLSAVERANQGCDP